MQQPTDRPQYNQKPKRDWPWGLLLVFIMFVIASVESLEVLL